MSQVETITMGGFMATMKKSKVISGIRLREDRAEALREKAIELTVQTKEMIKETDLVNYLIDEFAERIGIDQNGFFVREDEE